MNCWQDRSKEKKHLSKRTPRANWVWEREKKLTGRKKKLNEQIDFIHLNFPLFSLEGEQDRREGKKKLICLQTRNGVHAEIAGGFGLESVATTVCTATFASFILCLLNKWIK